jgi:hypothetical protein
MYKHCTCVKIPFFFLFFLTNWIWFVQHSWCYTAIAPNHWSKLTLALHFLNMITEVIHVCYYHQVTGRAFVNPRSDESCSCSCRRSGLPTARAPVGGMARYSDAMVASYGAWCLLLGYITLWWVLVTISYMCSICYGVVCVCGDKWWLVDF